MTTILTHDQNEDIDSFAQTDTAERLLTDREVEMCLRVARGWAAKDRTGKARIPFVKLGRSVRYRRSDVESFIAANVRRSTSDVGGAR